jgi:RHS repeat-associated protein
MLRTETRQTAVQITRTPDSAGRLDTVAIPGGLIDYDYYSASTPSGAGKTSDVHGPYGTDLHFTYDGMLATGMTWSGDVSGSVTWAYNSDFNKILETVSGASGSAQAVFGYDDDQLLTCVSPTTCSPAGSDALRLTRHSQHGLITRIRLGSTTEDLTYNTLGELAQQTTTYTGVTPAVVDVTYHSTSAPRDALGRIVKKTETIGGTTNTFEYTYDTLRRLTDVTLNGTLAEHFVYDTNGNRTLGTNTAAGTSYTGTYDTQDRLLTYGPWTFTYTANGELETKTNTETEEEWAFQYDALGNLLSVGLPNGDLVEYLVDGLGRRVGKKKNGVLLKQWIYRDALKPVAELDGSGALVAEFVYGSKGVVPDYVRRGGNTYRVISDHLGSPRYVLNVANSADAPFRADYSSFGDVTGMGLSWMPFGFAGGHYDADSGLVRFGVRDYAGGVGRWISKDPIRFLGGRNMFLYSMGDPVNLADPLGLYTEVIFWQPVGWGASSFGHVSIDINGTTYSWAPGGMTIEPTPAYISRNTRFRSGRGLILGLSQSEEYALDAYLAGYSGAYGAVSNNCTDPIENGLEWIGKRHGMDSLLPTGLALSLSGLAIGQTAYPGGSGNIWGPPWSTATKNSFWSMY